MSIQVENLTKIYDTQKAVDDISFSIQKGEIVGFLGPNGAGKTTTMRMISCFISPTSGVAYINGKSILDDPVKIREDIGYLPESNPLYTDMFIREYLMFNCRIHKIKGSKSAKISKVIEQTGLGPEIHKKIGALSKGYRQRVGLAQVLIHDPEVLLLDEPTSGLDPNQIIEIRDLIKEIGKEKTIILSSHIMQEVQAMCNRIVIINKGKIVADDETDKLLNDKVKQFYISVEFKNGVSKEDLLKIKFVESARKDNKTWIIQASDNEVREKIFEFAVTKNNAIIEMSKEGENLEEVFRRLTSKK